MAIENNIFFGGTMADWQAPRWVRVMLNTILAILFAWGCWAQWHEGVRASAVVFGLAAVVSGYGAIFGNRKDRSLKNVLDCARRRKAERTVEFFPYFEVVDGRSDFEKRIDAGLASVDPPTPAWVKTGLCLIVALVVSGLLWFFFGDPRKFDNI